MDYSLKKDKKFSDSRGDLVVFLKKSELKKNDQKFGQIYFVTFNKTGAIRGNHFHHKWREWFGIASGRVEVFLEDVKTKKRIHLYLDSKYDRYSRLEIGPYIAHTFKSRSNEAVLLNYANGEWHDSDTYPYKII